MRSPLQAALAWACCRQPSRRPASCLPPAMPAAAPQPAVQHPVRLLLVKPSGETSTTTEDLQCGAHTTKSSTSSATWR